MPSREPDLLWSDLGPGLQSVYRKQGYTPQTWNAWRRLTPEARTAATVEARRLGYSSGLQRRWAFGQKRLNAQNADSERERRRLDAGLARALVQDGNLDALPDLFEFNADDHDAWTNILSP
jgi:hypothetical protein